MTPVVGIGPTCSEKDGGKLCGKPVFYGTLCYAHWKVQQVGR